jgi:hypothetical protein
METRNIKNNKNFRSFRAFKLSCFRDEKFVWACRGEAFGEEGFVADKKIDGAL